MLYEVITSSMFGIMSAFIAAGMIIYLCAGRKKKQVPDEVIDRIIEETSEDMTIIDI